MKIPKFVYYLTHKNNLEPILCDGVLKSSTNTIYVCPSKWDIAGFGRLIIKTDLSDYVLFKIDTSSSISNLWELHHLNHVDASALVYRAPELPLGEDFEVEVFAPVETLLSCYK